MRGGRQRHKSCCAAPARLCCAARRAARVFTVRGCACARALAGQALCGAGTGCTQHADFLAACERPGRLAPRSPLQLPRAERRPGAQRGPAGSGRPRL